MRALLAALSLLGLTAAAFSEEDPAAARRQMVEEIKALAASIAGETGIAEFDPRVLAAMGEVPRHEFVPATERQAAYRNRPLPIGHGQTISQPFIVALMTELLQLKCTNKVLEVGTGSGYQAAILSVLAREVYSIEIIPQLGEAAANVLRRQGYSNVKTMTGDGYQGWAEHAPFDAIIVTAAPDHVPPALVEQLKPNGRMVIPVGDFTQDLMVVTKRPDGATINKTVVPVQFVPLIRE